MPPASKRPASSTNKGKAKASAQPHAQADARPTIATLLARCSRGDLERMLEESVTDAVPVTFDKVCSLLPEKKQALTIQRTTLVDGPAREGTGLFDQLDDGLLIGIISLVSCTKTRVACAIAVCKAWRGVLRNSTPPFAKLNLEASRSARFSPSGSLGITSSNFARFITWLPQIGAVTSLTLGTGDKYAWIDPNLVKRVIPLFTGLTHLSLSGKKTTSAVLSVVAKQPFCSNLISFEMRGTTAPSSDALGVLSQATRLESLSVDLGYKAGSLLSTLAERWREKRGGGASPLLSRLVHEGYYFEALPMANFQSLAGQFPELTELRKLKLVGVAVDTNLDLSSVRQMARLRILDIISLVPMFGEHLSDDQLCHLLRLICTTAPNLTSLTVRHGQKYVSGRDRKAGMRDAPLPSPLQALTFLPPSLKNLELGTMRLEPTAFDMMADLSSLEKLSLTGCGNDATAIATRLANDNDCCPKLALKNCWIDHACLDPVEEAKRKAELKAFHDRLSGRRVL